MTHRPYAIPFLFFFFVLYAYSFVSAEPKQTKVDTMNNNNVDAGEPVPVLI
jgi:hypothetical protein